MPVMSDEQILALPIEAVVPHKPPMVLIKRLLEFHDEGLVAEACPLEGDPFVRDGKAGAWVGIEYMAQSVAAFAGCVHLRENEPVKVGFLLGTRRYESSTPFFRAGEPLRISVKRVLHDPDGLSSVECQILPFKGGDPLAKALLTVYEVKDLGGYLKEHVK